MGDVEWNQNIFLAVFFHRTENNFFSGNVLLIFKLNFFVLASKNFSHYFIYLAIRDHGSFSRDIPELNVRRRSSILIQIDDIDIR